MVWQRSHDVAGPLLSRPHTCCFTCNGGERTPILCVLTYPCGSCSCSRESERGSWWHNATSSILRRWQQGKRTDVELQGKCCVIPCLRSHAQPFESHRSGKASHAMAVGGSKEMRADGGGELEGEAASLD